MGVASILLAVLLAVEVDLRMSMAVTPASPLPELTVDLRNRPPVQIHGPDHGAPVIELEPIAIEVTERVGEIVPAVESTIEPEPVRDWQAVIAVSAKEAVSEYYRQEDIRAAMWQQSYSTMFKGEDVFDSLVATPILDDFQFREPVGVLGVGLTIGSCFFGVPLAGIPVEERTVAITILYCNG